MYATVVPSSDVIQVTFTGVSYTVDYYCSYYNSSNGLGVENNTVSTSGPWTLVPSPSGVGETNQVRAISIYVESSSTGALLINIQYNNGTPLQILLEISLGSNYTLTYTADGSGWQVYDSNGNRL